MISTDKAAFKKKAFRILPNLILEKLYLPLCFFPFWCNSNFSQPKIAAMNDLIGNFIITADPWLGRIQSEMDARYVEQSSLTNLFTEHKFWGWAGLLSIFVALAAIFYFQFQAWEQEDQEREKLKHKQKGFVEFIDKTSNQAKE